MLYCCWFFSLPWLVLNPLCLKSCCLSHPDRLHESTCDLTTVSRLLLLLSLGPDFIQFSLIQIWIWMPLSSHSTSVQLLSHKLEFNSSLSVYLIIFPCLLLIVHFDPARTKKTRKKQASKDGRFLIEKPRIAFVFIIFCLLGHCQYLSCLMSLCPRKPVQACSVKLPVSCTTTRARSSIERECFAKKGHLLGKEDLLMYKHLLASVPAFRAWRNVLKKSGAARLEKGLGPSSWLSCSQSKVLGSFPSLW